MADNVKTKARLEAIRGASDAELQVSIDASRKAIYQFRKDRLSKPQENVKVIRNSRKDIARIMTIRRQRELAAAHEGTK